MGRQMLMFYALGTLALIAIMLTLRKNYQMPAIKSVLFALSCGVAGIPSTKLMFLLENGDIDGASFFGAVFFMPLFILPFVFLLRIKYIDALDLIPPGGILMCGIVKINCFLVGCCAGKILRYDAQGLPVRFPSQLTEMTACFLICAVLIILIKNGKCRGHIYPVLLVVYGMVRFILNFFREGEDFLVGLQIGNFWALIAVIAGAAWLLLAYHFEAKKMAG